MQTAILESFEINAGIILANPSIPGLRIGNKNGKLSFDSANQRFEIFISKLKSFHLYKHELCPLPRANCPNGITYYFPFNKSSLSEFKEVCLRNISESDKRKLHNCLLKMIGTRQFATSRNANSTNLRPPSSVMAAISPPDSGRVARRPVINQPNCDGSFGGTVSLNDTNSEQPSEPDSQPAATVHNKRPRLLDQSAVLPLDVPESLQSVQRLESENRDLRLKLECAELKLTVGGLRTELREAKSALEKESAERQLDCEKMRKDIEVLEKQKKEMATKLEEAEQSNWMGVCALRAKEREAEKLQKEVEKTRANLEEANKVLEQIGQLERSYQANASQGV